MKVFIVATMTADGFIARNSNELVDWSSKEDKKLFVQLTKQAGVMVMGRSTFETIGRPLPGRRNIVYTRRPLDMEGIETTQEDPRALIQRLASEGVQELAVCGGASIYSQYMQAGVVDELYLPIEPRLFGDGIKLFDGTALDVELELLDTRKLNDNTVLLHYTVKH